MTDQKFMRSRDRLGLTSWRMMTFLLMTWVVTSASAITSQPATFINASTTANSATPATTAATTQATTKDDATYNTNNNNTTSTDDIIGVRADDTASLGDGSSGDDTPDDRGSNVSDGDDSDGQYHLLHIPHTSSPASMSLEMSEFTPAFTCLNPVGGEPITCTPSSQLVLQNVQVTHYGDLANKFSVNINQQPDTTSLQIFVCVGSTASFLPGYYEITVTISYLAGGVSGSLEVQANLTITDVNETPEVDLATDEFAVPETAPVGTVVFAFNVSDPDARAPNGREDFRTIQEVKLVLNGSTSSDLNLEVLGNGSYQVVVASTLNASITDQYTGYISVMDGGPLGTASSVKVIVSDVNEAPQCVSYDVTIDVTPLTSVGTVLGQLACWDWDPTPAFGDIEFSPSSLWSVVTVSNNGTITLTSPVTLDTTSNDTVISAHAPGYPQPSVGITVSLRVQFFPPQCGPVDLSARSVMPDSVPVGTCIGRDVPCVSSSSSSSGGAGGGGFNVSLGTQGPLGWELVQGDPDTDTVLFFDICVIQLLNYTLAGHYNVTLLVSNATGVASVTIEVEVVDTNQAPAFVTLLQSPLVFLAEDTAPQSSVARVQLISSISDVMAVQSDVIYVLDSDDVTGPYGFSNVSFVESVVTFPNLTTALYGLADQSPIYLQDSTDDPRVYHLVTQAALWPRSNISVTLKAADREGLTDTSTVVFVVEEVPQPPVCVSASFNVTLPLAAPVGAPVYTLQCSGSSRLTFSELPTEDYDYFTVNGTDGDVTLQAHVPLHALEMTYGVVVTDDQGLSTNFTLYVSVERDYPPECAEKSGTVILTQTYEGTRCQNVTLTCDHLPALRSYALAVNYSFTYDADLFDVDRYKIPDAAAQESNQTTLQVCARIDSLNISYPYDLIVTVSSELGAISYFWEAEVQYLNTPPAFNQTDYFFTAAEDLPQGAVVAEVVDGVSEADWERGKVGTAPDRVFVIDPDLVLGFGLDDVIRTNIWHYGRDGSSMAGAQGYQQGIVYSSDQQFTVNADLVAGHTYLFQLTARDFAGAEASVNVTFLVSDVNQAPACAKPEDNVTVDLTSWVGLKVYDVMCSDGDVDPLFRNLTYGEYSKGGFEYFSIQEDTGEVMLTSALPTDVVTLQYDVYVRDGLGLTANFTLLVNIYRDYEVLCSPTSPYNITFRETDTNGCAPTLVTCVDTSGRDLPVTFDVRSDATQGNVSIVAANMAGGNSTALRACVQRSPSSPLIPVGEFEIVVEVTNTLRVTSLTFNVTITDVNQPPYFEQPTYTLTVPEDVAQGHRVAVVRQPSDPQQDGVLNIVSGDPDTLTPSFKMTSLMYAVTAVYVNGTEFNLSLSEPIRVQGFNIVVEDTLRPDVIYSCALTAIDGQGLTANTTLIMAVSDVNEAPSCQDPQQHQTALDLLTPVPSALLSLADLCHDPDFNLTLRSLRFFAYPDHHNASFFNVSENGDVILVTSVPRDAEQLELTGYAVDGGGLTDNVTFIFDIDRDHPPECNPAYVPPDGVWVQNTCFRVQPNCSDPTTPPGDNAHLVYDFSGTWVDAFRQAVSPNQTHHYAEFCYLLTQDGTYTVRMNVTNGLAAYVWETPILVSYSDAPPKFTVNRYISEVNETAPVGFPVLRVEALVDGRNVSLLYSLTGPGGQGQYFSISSSTGYISVAADLSSLVGTDTTGHVTALDPITGLNHSIPLKIKVLDVNQPPTCHPLLIDAAVPWGVKVTDDVATLNCSDPDPTAGFSTLTYQVNVGREMWRSEQNKVRLISRALLEHDRSVYVLTVIASDGVFSATVSVTVNIDRTPPKPVLAVSNVQADSANVSWTFDPDYVPVVRQFTVTLAPPSDAPVSRNVSKTRTSYLLQDLMPELQYRVRVTVDGLQDDVTSDDVSFQTPPVAILKEACTELHLVAETWTNDLSNNRSQPFLTLRNNLSAAVDRELRSLNGYVGCTVRSFRPGSVKADVLLVTNQSLSSMNALQTAVVRLVSTGSISGIAVNSSHSPFFLGSFYLTSLTLAYTSPGKILNANNISHNHLLVSGIDVTATCDVRTPGYWHPVFEWWLGGNDVKSLASSGRAVMTEVVRSGLDPFRLTSTLTVRRIFESESGNLTCRVRADSEEDSTDVTLRVVASVSASLTPPTTVVTPGSTVTLKCSRLAAYDVGWSAVFYRMEGGSRVELPRKSVGQSQNSTDLQIPGVTSQFRAQCNVTDGYGWALSNEADVIIRRIDADLCPEDDIWPSTPAGNTARVQCPEGYNVTGLQERTCNTGGEWGNIDTSQCVRLDLQGYKTLLKEGTTINTTWEVVRRVANSTSGPLLTGDISAVAAILGDVVNVTAQSQHVVVPSELQDFVMSAGNAMQAPTEVWLSQTEVAQSLVHSVDKMGREAAKSGTTFPEPIETDKIVVEVSRTGIEDILFPHPDRSGLYPTWLQEGVTSVYLSKDAFPDNVRELAYSAVIYRNLTNVFSTQLDQDLAGQGNLSVNSPILALSVLQLPADRIQRPVKLAFQHITGNFSSTSCQFLNFSASAEGVWSDSGCTVTSRNSTMTLCECDHMTNFAVLMSPYRPTSTVADVLNIFSIVGCSVSIVCLLLTVVIYRVFWRHVKSDRSIILMNLCVILILAYVIFLAGVNRVQYETVCTVVAALLHYLWLVVFFLMLCEGLDIFISVVIIFPIKSVLLKLLLMAYGVPAIIVGVSLGITRLEGYGGADFCWLSLKNNLLWAFVGPALAALLANFVFVALVIRALLSTTAMITKANRERAKSVLKAICVMTPILGLAWIFGVMAVNNETVVFQILFVIFNSLQGLMIFVFHCLLSKQIREGFKKKKRQRQASSDAKYSVGEYGASKYTPQKRTSETSLSSNDLGKSTSPFLQVDRQVQRMAAKMSLMDSPNILTADDPPKDVVLKDPVARATTGPGLDNPFLNIGPNESTTDDVEPAQAEPERLGVDPNFRIESGNLSTFSTPIPTSTTDPEPFVPRPTTTTTMSVTATTTTTTTTTKAVVEKQSLRHTDSVEDNEKQTHVAMQVLNLSSSHPVRAFGDTKGDHPGAVLRKRESMSDKGDSSSDVAADRGRSQKSSSRKSGKEKSSQPAREQGARLDQVYGAGARVSHDPNPSAGRPYIKHKGGRAVKSAESMTKPTSPKNPVHSDVMPSLSPTARWIHAAQAIGRRPHRPSSRSPPHHHPAPFPQHQHPRPPSPRRLSTSADGSEAFPPFSAPRQGEVRHLSHKRPPPPKPAPKPSQWRHEPPVDYW